MKKLKDFLNENQEQLDEKNKPTSPEKWARAKAAAKSKFSVYPSAYANAWASKKYKSMGGGWRSTKEEVEYGDESEIIWEAEDHKEDHSGTEVKVFDYETHYFFVCPLATNLYRNIEDKIEDDEYDLYEGMAKLQDSLFFIEKHLNDKKGKPHEEDMGYLLMAQNIKDQLDRMLTMTSTKMRIAHGYLQSHIDAIKKALDFDNRMDELDEQYDWDEEEQAWRRNDLYYEGEDYEWLEESAAWRRKEGKSASGGLNRKGIMSYRRENPGSKLKMAVTGKVKPGSKAAKRRKSFCARMGGMKGPMKKPNGEPTRKALALRKWKCR